MLAPTGKKALRVIAIALGAIVGVGIGALAGRWTPAPSLALSSARQRWASDAARVDASLTALEDRLLATQARVRLWNELRTRHESVSQVACQNLGEHARAMVAAAERTKEQARAGRRGRLAANAAGPSGTGPF